MTEQMRSWLTLALACAALSAAFAAGWAVNGWRAEAEISRLERAYADQAARDAQAATARLDAANRRNDAIAQRLAASESTRKTLAQEKDHALRALTTGRRCLDAAAVRVLNGAADTAGAVPPAGGQPVSADARFATDTDVGLWVRGCRDAYDTCRGRLDAIRQFYAPGNESTGDAP